MSTKGFTISKLVVQGQGMEDAILEFRQGLNVIAGASNTGKTYAWQLIDYMFGASKPAKDIPPARRYTHSKIELRPHKGGVITLSRALAGGAALLNRVAIKDIHGNTPCTKLAEKHDQANINTISGCLLNLTGLFGKQVRKNAQGVKRSLSFRDVAWLTLVDEERIITERSPVLSGQYASPTEEQSAFGLLITGVDDAAIITHEKPEQRKLRIEAEKNILERLLDNREARFESYGVDIQELPGQRERLANAVKEASSLLAAQQAELNHAAEQRDKAWSKTQAIQSRRLFLGEQIKRLELLKEHYASDSARLESALEAGELFERLPQGICPVCGHAPESSEHGEQTDQRLKEFQEACKAELAKITALSKDLCVGLEQMHADDQHLMSQTEKLGTIINNANAAIDELLNRKVKSTETQLSELLKLQSHLTEAAFAANEVSDLRARYSAAGQNLSIKVQPPKFTKKVEAAGLVEFCQVIAATLKAWKFPGNNVGWSDEHFDLIIGNENRGSLGKGRRAVTHAAFTISLMRYCRMKGLPHPGIVILDTPLNPYKGPDKSATEGMNTEVQEAFYADLAADSSGDQVIVFENTEPAANLRNMMQYEHFSGTPGSGRAGFFPQAPGHLI
jgi:hypothetical protein